MNADIMTANTDINETAIDTDAIDRTVTVYDMQYFMGKLAAWNRKCAKLGMEPADVTATERVTERTVFGDEVFVCYIVTVTQSRIQLPGGWRLVASLDHTEKLVRCVPGNDLPAQYSAHESKCDHCQHRRFRTETFVLVDADGNTIQVGRNCLGSFLGVDAHRLLGQIDTSGRVDMDEWSGMKTPAGIDLKVFLTHTVAMIRTSGWASRATAASMPGTRSTADRAMSNIVDTRDRRKDKFGNPMWTDTIASDGDMADRTVEWLVALAQRDGLGDYMNNLRQIGENGFVTFRSSGFAASAVNAMQKELEETIVRERQKTAPRQHLGVVGGKLVGEFTLIASPGFDTEWGYTFIHRFADADGNTVVWRTTTELEPGKVYQMSATIKAHDDYKGIPQTVVTRARMK